MVEFGDLLLKITVGSFLALVLQTKKASVLGGFFDGILVVGNLDSSNGLQPLSRLRRDSGVLMVGEPGFEPGTPVLSGQCSNQLSYSPSEI